MILDLIVTMLSIPLIALGNECLAMLWYQQKPTYLVDFTVNTITYKILVPAHNKAGIIGKTLAGLMAQLPDVQLRRVVVVADNCKDAPPTSPKCMPRRCWNAKMPASSVKILLWISAPPLLALLVVSGKVTLQFIQPKYKPPATLYLFVLTCFMQPLHCLRLVALWRISVSAKKLLSIPTYIISKINLYIAYIFETAKKWVKTDRDK